MFVEFDEIWGLFDWVLVMFDGKVVGECGVDVDEGDFGLLMVGVEDDNRI